MAPVAVLLLGLVYVGMAVARLDEIHDHGAGVLRSWQLAAHPLAVGHEVRRVVGDVREWARGQQWAEGLCRRQALADLCRSDPPLQPLESDRLAALEASARQLVGGGGEANADGDVSVAHWQPGGDRVTVVAVARFPTAEAAAQALAASAAVPTAAVHGRAVARTAWSAGRQVVIGVVASASDQASADAQLAASTREVTAYVGMARALWLEALAVGPFLVLFVLWVTARYLAVLVSAAVFAAVGIPVVLVLVVASALYLLARLITGKKVRGTLGRNAAAGAVTPAADGPGVRARHLEVPGTVMGVDDGEREAFLVVIVLIGFGIAAMTTPLLPGSLAWGSLALACVSSAWTRTSRVLPKLRVLLRVLLGIAVAGMVIGLAPHRLLDGLVFQLAFVGLSIAVLVAQWRDLTAGTELTYSHKWYEDVDARSTLYLVGAAVLMIAAGSLFLASNGNPVLRSHLAEKGLAAVGLLVALRASANVRASRDAARRDAARERGTPPVLYLRSFGDDDLTVRSPRMHRVGLERLSWSRRELFEDVIARALSRIGPVVAIAQPGTGQRDLGPARDSIVTDDWLAAVKAYMGEASLVAVVIGSSEGLVQELETLGELGLLDRLCVFVPPVDGEEAARRLALLRSRPGYSDTWGALHEDKKHKIVALTSVAGARTVVTAPRRSAYAYRRAAEDIPGTGRVTVGATRT